MDALAIERKIIVKSRRLIKLRHPRAEHQYMVTIFLIAHGNANGQEEDELHFLFSTKFRIGKFNF